MKILFVICAAALMMSGAMAEARPIVNPDGSMPRVQWAVVESKEGGMDKMQALAARRQTNHKCSPTAPARTARP